MSKQTQISRPRRVLQLIFKFIDKLTVDNVPAYSAQTAFFVILSLFPFFILLMNILQYTSLTEDTLLSLCDTYLPSTFQGIATTFLDELYERRSRTFFSLYILSALWLGSQGFVSMFTGLNSVYDIKEQNNYFKVRLLSILYTVAFMIIVIICLILLVFGNKLAYLVIAYIPQLHNHVSAIISIRILLVGTLLTFVFMTMYASMPNHKAHGNRISLLAHFPGAMFSTAGWIAFSAIYAYYIDHISRYASIYGTMTTIAFLMIWLYFCMFIIFIGGALNHVIQTKPFFHGFRRRLPEFLLVKKVLDK